MAEIRPSFFQQNDFDNGENAKTFALSPFPDYVTFNSIFFTEIISKLFFIWKLSTDTFMEELQAVPS